MKFKMGFLVRLTAVIFLLVLSLGISACSVSKNENETQTPEATITIEPTEVVKRKKVFLTTTDGIELAATYFPAMNADSSANAILLLHEAYKDRRAWFGFANAAQEAGYTVLALDLRGHGQSSGESTFDEAMDKDVDAALAWLTTSTDVTFNQIGIAGASLGANLALRAAANHPEIKPVILLSPGMRLWELDIAEAIVDYDPRPLFLVASEEDAYPYETVQTLDEQASGKHQVIIYPGATHGAELLNSQPDLIPQMLDWFQTTMK